LSSGQYTTTFSSVNLAGCSVGYSEISESGVTRSFPFYRGMLLSLLHVFHRFRIRFPTSFFPPLF